MRGIIDWTMTKVVTRCHCNSCEVEIYTCSQCRDYFRLDNSIICYQKANGSTGHIHKECMEFEE